MPDDLCECGHPGKAHLAGSWTWLECYVPGCGCRMFREPRLDSHAPSCAYLQRAV